MTSSVSETSPLRHLIVGAGSVLVARFVGAVSQFVFYLVVGNRFGAEGFGLFVLALTVSVVAATIGRWGVDQLMLRSLSGHYAHGEHGAFGALFVRCSLVVAVLSALVALAMWLLAPLMARLMFGRPELSEMLRVFAFSVAPMALIQLTGEGIRASGRPALSALVQMALVPLLALTLLAAAPDGDSVVNAALVYLAATLVVLLAALIAFVFQVFRSIPPKGGAADTPSSRALLSSATPMAWISILSVWLGFSETILLAGFRDAVEVGLYAATLRIALLVNFLFLAFNTVLAPRFAVLYRRGELPEIRTLARMSILAMLAAALPFFLALFLVPEALLGWFGDEFRVAAPALMILAFAQLICLATGPVGTILLMTANEQAMKRHTAVAVLVNLAVAVLLIPAWGVTGAATSAATGMILLYLLSWRTARELLQSGRHDQTAPG